MKKTIAAVAMAISLASAPAFAADLPMKARPLPPAPIWSWTGFYFGGHVGFGWGQDETRLDSVTTPGGVTPLNLTFNQNSRSGVLGGGQAGYNWQAGAFVFGVQGDIAALDVKGTDPCLIALTCTSKSDWLATATGRVGAVVLDRGLVYVKGGGAWLNTNHTTAINGVAVVPQITNGSFTNDGWLVGMGTEWMITQNFTAFVELDYMRFDDKKVNFALIPAPAVVFNTNQTQTLAIAKVGVNYKFGWGGPVVARY